MAITSEQAFHRFSIAAHDFERAIQFATEALKQPANSIIYEALLFAAIVSYWRPFSPNELSSTAEATKRLSIEQLGVTLTAEEQDLHDRCKRLRNEALAHSSWERNPTRLRESGVVASRIFSLLSPPFDVRALLHLAETLRVACEHQRADYVLGRRRGTRRQ